MITAAVVRSCHGKDGGLGSDDFLTDPEVCAFEPKELLCSAGDQPDCLTAEQVDALTAMYRGAHDPRTGEQIYYGWPKGSENSGYFVKGLPGWSLYWADPSHEDRPARLNFWKIWAFQNPDWDWRSFDFDAGMKTVDDRLAADINAMDPDLSAFRAAGGKLIQFHGLADPVVPPRESIDYYERVQARAAKSASPGADETADFYRLFLAPGLQHCQGGPGPNVLDTQSALEKWVEDKTPPSTINATKFRDDKPANGVDDIPAALPLSEAGALPRHRRPRGGVQLLVRRGSALSEPAARRRLSSLIESRVGRSWRRSLPTLEVMVRGDTNMRTLLAAACVVVSVLIALAEETRAFRGYASAPIQSMTG